MPKRAVPHGELAATARFVRVVDRAAAQFRVVAVENRLIDRKSAAVVYDRPAIGARLISAKHDAGDIHSTTRAPDPREFTSILDGGVLHGQGGRAVHCDAVVLPNIERQA